ncbi:MFS transporter [Nocardia fluminea]|uniref:MFS transporter n=1 Tax=Nocardia fluminea TaxID=134984 RepID=UPI003446D4B6
MRQRRSVCTCLSGTASGASLTAARQQRSQGMTSALHAMATRKATVRLVPLLFIAYFFSYLDRTNVGLAKSALEADLGISAAAYGFGAGIFFISYAVFEIPSNLILHRVGPRRWIARIAISWGLISAAMMFIQDPVSFYVLRFLLGAAEAGLYPGLMYVVTVWFAQKDRARIVGYLLLATSAAHILGSPLGGVLLSFDGSLGLHGWQWMFVIEGLPAAAIGIAIWFVLPDRPRDARWLTATEANALTDAADPAPGQRGEAGLLSRFLSPIIVTVAAIYLLNQVAGSGLVFFGPAVIQSLGVSGSFTIGALTGLAGVGTIAGLLVAPQLLRRFGNEVRLMASSLAGTIASTVSFFLASSGVMKFAMIVCIGFFLSGVLPLFWSVTMAQISGRTAAAALAFVNTVGVSGGFFGPYLFGIAEETTGNSASGLWILVGSAVISLALLPILANALRRRTPPSSESAPSPQPSDVTPA